MYLIKEISRRKFLLGPIVQQGQNPTDIIMWWSGKLLCHSGSNSDNWTNTSYITQQRIWNAESPTERRLCRVA